MRFRVDSTIWCCENEIDNLLDKYPHLKDLNLRKEVVDREIYHGTRKETVVTIEIKTLKQLMDLATNVEYTLIVDPIDDYKMPHIEIYDGYRE